MNASCPAAFADVWLADAMPPHPVCIAVEQAIFTSIRSPMGEGYRLVAMSPGITAEERAELTRRSPSHDSICDVDPSAVALAGYPLASGRHCVAWSRHAGREHTARGGLRVHTHLVVLDTHGFATFACDPFRVQAAMFAALGCEPELKPSACLESLALQADPLQLDSPDDDLLQQSFVVARGMIADHATLVVGACPLLPVVRWAFRLLPLACRREVSFSANLHYAAARQLQIVCLPTDGPELRRAAQGRDVRILNPHQPDNSTHESSSPIDAWLELAWSWRDPQRLLALSQLTCEIDGPLEDGTLDRIAHLCREIDRLTDASQSELEAIVTTHADRRPPHPIEAKLLRHLLSAAVRQAASLQRAPVSVA